MIGTYWQKDILVSEAFTVPYFSNLASCCWKHRSELFLYLGFKASLLI